MLRVAVKLPPAPGRIGDYVADVTALEASGADSIWIDASGASSTEPWILLGAIAAVTHRTRLGVVLGSVDRWPDAVHILGRLAGRVAMSVSPRPESKVLFAQLKSQPSAASEPSILIACGTQLEAERSAQLADGVILPGGAEEVRALRVARAKDSDFEIWLEIPIPTDKAGWASMMATLEAAGATGVMVPWDARIIDLLRNAGDADDRTDLLIAAG